MDSLSPGTLIVTGSDRLARHLHEHHARGQLAAGRTAWERMAILPVGAFWRGLAERLQQDPESPLATRQVLARHAVLCRWEQMLAESFADKPLLQLAGAARTALDAWQLCHDRLLDLEALANDPLEETRLLIAWGRRFEAECAAARQLPDYALPEAVLGALERVRNKPRWLPECIQLAGFIEISPREQRQWDALAALGVAIEHRVEDATESHAVRTPCADAREEMLAAAAWARALLETHADSRIAIVVPDLATRRASLKRILLEALAPQHLFSFSRQPLPFNFSLGEPIAQQALVNDALTVLSFTDDVIEFASAARVCRSPYFGPEEESARRLQLEAVLRREGFAAFSLADWQRVAERNACSMLASRIAELRETVRLERDKVLPSQWARRFSQWLDRFGWCRGRSLESEEFQAREAWHDILGRLGELDAVLGKVTHGIAFSWLRRLANETLFQPRVADAPVQVMGLLEATGMHFDAVWVMGMSDETLPSAPRPNPFLPIDVQRDRKLPQSSAQRELVFARQLFQGLECAAPKVVFSHPLREKDAELGASPLLHGLPLQEAPAHFPDIACALSGSATRERTEDRNGPPHAGGAVRGGTALLQNQSHCPFRAFAIHRLQADDWPTPQHGPDARVKGLIAHRVLEKLWHQWRSRAVLERVRDKGELETAIRATVTDVVNMERQRAPWQWHDTLCEIEITRVTGVMLRWFEQVELVRPDFHVQEIEGMHADGTELETLVQAGPLRLRGKLDRVDRLADGRELIIDYKTGEAPRPAHFFGVRPAAPQLPAYLVARKQAGAAVAAGIAVASLRAGRESLHGVMEVEGDARYAGVANLVNVSKAAEVKDWNEAVTQWEQSIAALGESFAAGVADVEPLPGACTWCHLATLCRIQEDACMSEEEDND